MSTSIAEGNKEQRDLFKYITKTDFDSPEVLEQMEFIKEEIKKVLEGAKIDYSKMNTVFNMDKIADRFVKNHTPVGFTGYKNFFMAGMMAGLMYTSLTPINKP